MLANKRIIQKMHHFFWHLFFQSTDFPRATARGDQCYPTIFRRRGALQIFDSTAGLSDFRTRITGTVGNGFRQLQWNSVELGCGSSYAAMLLISCTMRSCSVSSSSKRNTCIKTFSVKPSAFASFAGVTFLNLSSVNTISLAMAISPFHVPEHFYGVRSTYPWAQNHYMTRLDKSQWIWYDMSIKRWVDFYF